MLGGFLILSISGPILLWGYFYPLSNMYWPRNQLKWPFGFIHGVVHLSRGVFTTAGLVWTSSSLHCDHSVCMSCLHTLLSAIIAECCWMCKAACACISMLWLQVIAWCSGFLFTHCVIMKECSWWCVCQQSSTNQSFVHDSAKQLAYSLQRAWASMSSSSADTYDTLRPSDHLYLVLRCSCITD